MDRKSYNACMRPYMTGGSKTKEERQNSFCIGAKICSGKAKNESEARVLCAEPKTSKPVKTRKNKPLDTAEVCDPSQFFELASQFKNIYIDVTSTRCVPCKELGALIKDADIPYPIVTVPEECVEIIDQLGVQSFPTVVKMEKGKIKALHTMSPEDTIAKMIKGV